MNEYLNGDTPWERDTRAWIEVNRGLRDHILRRLRREGPLRSLDFQDQAMEAWRSSGRTAGRNVDRMLSFLWRKGRILVAVRGGLQKVWDLAARCLPQWTPRKPIGETAAVRAAAQRSLRALGIGTARHIQ